MAGFGSHHHHHKMHAELAVLLAAPSSQLQATSLASTMATVPHHATATYTGEAPKRATARARGSARVHSWKLVLSFCVLVAIGYLAPPRQVGGRAPRDAPGRCPSKNTKRRQRSTHNRQSTRRKAVFPWKNSVPPHLALGADYLHIAHLLALSSRFFRDLFDWLVQTRV